MALKFQAPNLPVPKSKYEALSETAGQTVATMPLLWQQYKLQKMQNELALKKLEQENRTLDMQQQAYNSQYGMGMGKIQAQQDIANEIGAQPYEPTQVDMIDALGPAKYTALKPEKQDRLSTDQWWAQQFQERGQPAVQEFIEYSKAKMPDTSLVMPPTSPGEAPTVTNIGKTRAQIVPNPLGQADAKTKMKLDAEKPKAWGALKEALASYDKMITGADEILRDKSLGKATGYVAGRLTLPGGATRVATNIQTLKDQGLVNTINSMKSLSKNGSTGFGALNEKEGEALRNAQGNLNRTQDTPDFSKKLTQARDDWKRARQNLLDTFNETYGPMDGDGGLPSVGGSFSGGTVISVEPL